MADVEVIKAVEGPILRKRDYEGKPLVITRQRVAAYVRVSTDDEEQLEIFRKYSGYSSVCTSFEEQRYCSYF